MSLFKKNNPQNTPTDEQSEGKPKPYLKKGSPFKKVPFKKNPSPSLPKKPSKPSHFKQAPSKKPPPPPVAHEYSPRLEENEPVLPPVFIGKSKAEIKVRLFPNTGHHFFFIGFENLPKDFDTSELPLSWKELRAENGRYAKWGLFRAGTHKSEEGFWICLESNIGTNKRGSTYVSRCESERHGQSPAHIPTPYIAESLPELPQPDEEHHLFLCTNTGTKAFVKISVSWRQAMSQRPINVDLIVDFGNSRTVVLMNEEPTVDSGAPAHESLSKIVRTVPFLPRDDLFSGNLDSDDHILNSWFITHQPQFSDREPPILKESDAVRDEVTDIEGYVDYERRLIPQTFVEMAPVILGNGAEKVLGNIDLSEGGRYFLGSPKRYVWDNEVLSDQGAALFWCMVNNPWTDGAPTNRLAANVLRFMHVSGEDWDYSSPPNELRAAQRPLANPPEPLYPNADAMTWVALGIIENAYRMMNSPEFVKDNNPNVLRHLNSIQVTFPSGWTKAEIEAYNSKWKKAVNIFALNHLPDNQVPTLEFPVDEAVAAQLPIIFSEILKMGGKGDNWLELVGRPIPQEESGNKAPHRARVMTIDIGGGTTDYGIIEYEDQQRGVGVILHSKLLFKDSTTIAGDELVLNLIQKLLLPKLGANLQNEEQKEQFRSVFSSGQSTARDREEWKRITRLILIPKIHQWFKDICAGNSPSSGHPDFHQPTLDRLNYYVESNGLPGNLFKNDINVSTSEIEKIIDSTFRQTFERFSTYICAFEVDQIVICGKPSEIPAIGDLVEEILPLSPQRIIRVKDFDAGTWYPFHKAGKIRDAKTVTAVGVALQTAIKYGKINGWSIRNSVSKYMQTNNYWVVMGSNEEEILLLDKHEAEKTVNIQPNSYIGRRLQPGSNADQVYILEWCGEANERPMQVKISVTRKAIQGESEELELDNVESLEGEDLNSYIRLKLCTLNGRSHWIDSPTFEVQWDDDDEDMYLF